MNDLLKNIISQYEQNVSKIILYCVNELPFPLGVKRLISVLKGAKSSFNLQYELYKLDTFSLLSGFSGKQISTIIEILIKHEMLKVKYVSEFNNIPVLTITCIGKDFLQGDLQLSVSFMDELIDKDVPEFDEFQQRLYNSLRALRYEISIKLNVPPFMICSDATLREIATQKPTNNEELIKIRGVGEKFIQNYGNEFLELITREIET